MTTYSMQHSKRIQPASAVNVKNIYGNNSRLLEW